VREAWQEPFQWLRNGSTHCVATRCSIAADQSVAGPQQSGRQSERAHLQGRPKCEAKHGGSESTGAATTLGAEESRRRVESAIMRTLSPRVLSRGARALLGGASQVNSSTTMKAALSRTRVRPLTSTPPMRETHGCYLRRMSRPLSRRYIWIKPGSARNVRVPADSDDPDSCPFPHSCRAHAALPH